MSSRKLSMTSTLFCGINVKNRELKMTARSEPPFEADIVRNFLRSEELVEIISIEAAKPKINLSVLQRFRSERLCLVF